MSVERRTADGNTPPTDDPSAYRPRGLSPVDLGFTRRRPVPWLSPVLLAGTAVRVVGAELFGAILDKRELQGALPGPVHDHSAGDELWLDYVADIGDGFDATYSMAWLLGQPELALPDAAADAGQRVLPRGHVLVMGGDEVYPTPSRTRYQDRSRGPYHAALPPGATGEPPVLYALPGNHDWYDGLTSFMRLFAKGGRFGGWRTRQTRSYFALRLPQRWWLFAVDEALDSYLDDPQLDYFRQAAEQLQPGDRVILCTSQPSWVYASREPHAYDTADHFIRSVIQPTGASVPVLFTGDLHHYARYELTEQTDQPGTDAPARSATPADETTAPADEAEPSRYGPCVPDNLITCGGGGAYLYPTHLLPERLTVPPADRLRRQGGPPRDYRLATTYPPRDRSRRMSWGILRRLLGHNAGFAAVLGVLHALLMFAFTTAGTRLLTAPVLTLVLVVFGATFAFAMSEPDVHRKLAHRACGLLHGIAQLGLAALGSWLWWLTPLEHLPGPLPVLLGLVIYLPVAGIVAAELTAVYLLVAGRFHVNVEELFAAQGIKDTKSMMRLHIDTDGRLTIYPIGLERAGRRWRAMPDAAPGAPWIAPTEPLRPRLIEEPLHLAGATQQAQAQS